ncbi:ABC transporter ATP-binding protein [Methanococcoides sp. SA1]|nr:ABC transporter ATP-binding protein [Methanococcoides sp. SA1]
MSILKVEGLNVDFSTMHGDVKAVNNVSFDVKKGESFGIIGESGSGKSVVGHAILRLLPDYANVNGSVFFDSKDIFSLNNRDMRNIRGREIALIPQNPSSSLNPVLRNGIQVEEVFDVEGTSRKKGMEKAFGIMRSLSLNDPLGICERYPHQLSGGMKQRLLASIALSATPKLVIADEPTKGLDEKARDGSVELFRKMRDEVGCSMLIISHDLDFVSSVCDRAAVMYSGEIVEINKTENILEVPQHPYTHGLVNAHPRNGLVPLDGLSPSRLDLPNGCFFGQRCKHHHENCGYHPQIRSHEGGAVRCHLY